MRPSIQDFLGHLDDSNVPKDSLDGLDFQGTQLNADKSLLEFLSSDTPRSDISSARTCDQDRAFGCGDGNENYQSEIPSSEKDNEHFANKSLNKPRLRNALLSSQNLSSKKHSSGYDKMKYKSMRTTETTVNDKEEQRLKAAQLIQIWWKRTRIRRTAGAAAMKRMMENKQMEIKQRLTMERERVCKCKVRSDSQMGI